MHVITDERCLDYSQRGHPERPQRVADTLALLREQKELKITWEKPAAVKDDALRRARRPCPDVRRFGLRRRRWSPCRRRPAQAPR